jgi:beta-galactosidase
MKTGFPLAEAFGASIKEFKLKGNLFDVELSDPELVLPGHCWVGTLQNQSAEAISHKDGEVMAVRHAFRGGEVVWIPTLLGLGGRLAGNSGLSTLLYQEANESIQQAPFRFTRHQPGILMRTLQAEGTYLTILINKQNTVIDLELMLPDATPTKTQPEVLYSLNKEVVRGQNKFQLSPEETLVLKWVSE